MREKNQPKPHELSTITFWPPIPDSDRGVMTWENVHHIELMGGLLKFFSQDDIAVVISVSGGSFIIEQQEPTPESSIIHEVGAANGLHIAGVER